MLYQPLEQLSYTAWALEGAAAGVARCFEVLDREDDVPDAPNAKPIVKARGEIEFRDVSFGYSHDRLILKKHQPDRSRKAKALPLWVAPERVRARC